MVINNGGNLSTEYFKAYFHLIMVTQGASLDHARDIAFARLFNNEATSLGDSSYNHFIEAYLEMKNVKTV
ncbi:hypothetical protein V1499_04490 [Neobacillus sp. SCS-31]|uniref:hypothetical protein n=1 Tax=Neobacillus oceani TaxID=3115292 RepID=UPI0039064FC1